MSIALYRKYRPQAFGDVTNQNHIKITLQNEIKTDRLGHAYLFCGPRGTGKTTLARILSKAVNCVDQPGDGEPCNKCKNCIEITSGKALDIIEVDAASHTGVDNVRDNIIDNARFTPTSQKYKVFIIDEVHMLSISAFNALLKILEEPPKYVIFILATTEVHKVPVTIISRCQRFDFKKIVYSELVARLKWIVTQEEVDVDEQVLGLVAKQAGGCVRDAESLLEQILSLGEKRITLEQAELIIPKGNFETLFQLLSLIVNKQTKEGIEMANKLVADGIDTAKFMDSFVEFTRKVLLYKLTGDLQEITREIDETVVPQVIKLSKQVNELYLSQIIKKFIETKDTFAQTYIAQLPLEMAIIELTQSGASSAPTTPLAPSNPITPITQPTEIPKAPEPTPPTPPIVQEFPKPVENTPPVAPEPPLEQAPPSPDPAPLENLKNSDIMYEQINPFAENQPIEDQESISTPLPVETPPVPSELVTVEPVAPQLPPTESSDMAPVLQAWSNVLETIKTSDYKLYMSLRMGKPILYNNGRITIGFLFELQRQNVEKPESLAVVRNYFTQALGAQIDIETKIDQTLTQADFQNNNGSGTATGNPSATPPDSNSQAEEVAREFGGEVLDT